VRSSQGALVKLHIQPNEELSEGGSHGSAYHDRRTKSAFGVPTLCFLRRFALNAVELVKHCMGFKELTQRPIFCYFKIGV
jgi:hypothetical protein